MSSRMRKVVFPVAGFGTRFLPATKSVAKELLPVLDQPLIQYAVDEAADAGADTLVFVTNRNKHDIANYFDCAFELEAKLRADGKQELLDMVQGTLPKGMRAVFVTQPQALGLGHAVLCARPVIGDEPFGVILPDDLILGARPGALRQMADVAEREQAAVLAVQDVPREKTGSYGIVDAQRIDERSSLVRHMVEKPSPDDAPSTLAVVGRYVLPARIFDLLANTRPGKGGEIQLTDAIDSLIRDGRVLAWRFEGQRFDCGNKLGMVEATVHLALRDPELAPAVRSLLERM
ncbi:MAG: UTP--glucose-1-phosphate uridylyltransferase GalU [Rhodanobacteraceae bacterium]